MDDGIGLAEKMLGLPGVVVLELEEHPGELVVRVESTKVRANCSSCRRRAEPTIASRSTCETCTASDGLLAW